MDKQAWTAVTLCVIGLLAWQYFYVSKYSVPPTPATATATASPGPASAQNPSADVTTPGSPIITSGKPENVTDSKEAAPAPIETVPEQIETVETPQIRLRFTNLGGGIAEAEPLGREHLAENGVNIKLNHAGQIPIGAVSDQPGTNTRLPYTLERDGQVVRYSRTEPGGLKITKEYSLDYQGDTRQIPAIHLKVTFTNGGAQAFHDDGYFVYAGSSAPIHRRDLPTYTSFDWLSDGRYQTDHATSFDASRIPIVNYERHPGRDVIETPIDHAAWIAVKNQFYATILAPIPAAPDQEVAAREIWARRFDLVPTPEDAALNLALLHGVDAALGMPALQLNPGETKTQDFQIYAGPKYYSRLDHLGHDEQEVMDFGKFKVVSITLLAMMNTFKSWLGSYGLAIILLTIIVKGVLFPLQNKANKSMKRMSALSPKMTELRERYKDDPTRLNTETMKLYKQYGVNPLGGCWPMLIQMPIFFGFLYMLYTSAELRNASFLWVRDLSQPDTVARFAGYPINVLPMIMIGTQFWQMSLTPKTGDPSQQKTLMFMPLLFGFFCYNFAAALALYYTMQGLLTILQLYLMRNQAPPTLEDGGSPKLAPAKGGKGGFMARAAAGLGKKTSAKR